MKYPWANVLILLLGAVALLTGFLGLLWGSPDRAAALHVHRVSGLAMVILLGWKGQNILGSLRRRRQWTRRLLLYGAFLFLLAVVVLLLTLGLVWSHAGPFTFLGISGVSWHVYLSVLVIPFVLWHTLFHRWSLRVPYWADRRAFFRLSGLALAGFLAWRADEALGGLLKLAGSTRRFTGSYERGSFSGNAFPATSWLDDDPPPVESAAWRLRVSGQVAQEVSLTYAAVAERHDRLTDTLDCTGGWYSTQEWEGFSLKRLLDQAGVRPEAASITVRSVTGYYRRFTLEESEGYILATRVGGEPLSHAHGFPARLVAPNKRGYDWVKWVTAVELNTTSKWWQPPLPLQ